MLFLRLESKVHVQLGVHLGALVLHALGIHPLHRGDEKPAEGSTGREGMPKRQGLRHESRPRSSHTSTLPDDSQEAYRNS